MLREVRRLVGDHGAIAPCGSMTDTSKPLRARDQVSLEDGLNAIAEPEVRRAHDGRGHSGLAVLAAGASRSNALDELGLAYHFEFLGAAGAIHRRALDEHRLPHVVRLHVGNQLIEQVPVPRSLPQMVMRIDDGKTRLEGGLLCQRKPVRRLRRRLLGREAGDRATPDRRDARPRGGNLACPIQKRTAGDPFV